MSAKHHILNKDYAAAHAFLDGLDDEETLDTHIEEVITLPRYTFFTQDMRMIPEIEQLFTRHQPSLHRLGHGDLVAQQTALAKLCLNL